MLKIYWPIGLTKDMAGRTDDGPLLERELLGYTRKLFDDTVRVEIGWMDKTTGLLASPYVGMINNVLLVNDILKAQDRGFDAATVGGHWDPGLWAAREAATIPVVGPGEAAMLTALTLGRRFAFLTVNERYVPIIEGNIQQYGLQARAITRRPVRKFGMTYDSLIRAFKGRDDEFLTELGIVARQCVEDGADVIVAGGQLFGPIFQKYAYFEIPNLGVPVVDVSACGLKMAQVLAELGRRIGLKKSQHMHSPFQTPDPGIVDEARGLVGL